MLHRFCFPCDSILISCANCCIKQYVKLTQNQKKDFVEIPFRNMYRGKERRVLLLTQNAKFCGPYPL